MMIIGLLSDILLLAATLGMAAWCRILKRRLEAFDDVDAGLGGKIAALSSQVDDLKASIAAAGERTEDHDTRLQAANAAADDRIGRMEMLLASLEDLEAEAETDARFLEADDADGQSDVAPEPTFSFGRGRTQA